MQCRIHGIIINECPAFLSPKPNEANLSIYIPDINVQILLDLYRVTSFFYVKKLCESELAVLPVAHITASISEWNPNSDYFYDQEQCFLSLVKTCCQNHQVDIRFLSKLNSITTIDNPFYNITGLTSRLELQKQASLLSTKWNIGIQVALNTLKNTTQFGTMVPQRNKYLSERFNISNRYIRYKRLGYEMFTDTYFANIKSYNGNTCTQLFTTTFNWTKVFNFRKEANIHYSLDILFKLVGVLSLLISNNSLAQTKGHFKTKYLQAQCAHKPINTYSLNQNKAEITIRENKKLTRCEHDKKKIPLILWDYTNQYFALIRSHTALNLLHLMNKVP